MGGVASVQVGVVEVSFTTPDPSSILVEGVPTADEAGAAAGEDVPVRLIDESEAVTAWATYSYYLEVELVSVSPGDLSPESPSEIVAAGLGLQAVPWDGWSLQRQGEHWFVEPLECNRSDPRLSWCCRCGIPVA